MLIRGNTILKPKDIYCLPVPGTYMRSYQLFEPGVFRLSRRDCAFYSVMIAASGDFGMLTVRSGTLRPLWSQPSSFTGSFVLDCFSEEGLIVEAYLESQPFLTISWREPDDKMV